MAITAAVDLSISIDSQSTSPHEEPFAESTFKNSFMEALLDMLIGNKAYDSDTLCQTMKVDYDIGIIAPKVDIFFKWVK